jgi:hypothetical protein
MTVLGGNMRQRKKEFPQYSEPFEIKNWWDTLIQEEGSSCPPFAFFLLSPSGDPLGGYLSKEGAELISSTGGKCFTLRIGKNGIRRIGGDQKLQSAESLRGKNRRVNTAYFKELLKDGVREGYDTRMADLFQIPSSELPCLIVFQGIFSQEHISVTFANMDEGEIAPRLKEIFSAISKAADADRLILGELESLRSKPIFQRNGREIISAGRNIAGKTYQIAIELWIKSLLTKPSA